MRRIPLIIVVLVLVIGACSSDASTTTTTTLPAPTTTTLPFVDRAAGPCSNFAAGLASAHGNRELSTVFDYGPPYRAVAEALRSLYSTDESVPGAAELVASMDEAALAWDDFHAALQAAIEPVDAAMMDILATEGGTVYLVPEGDFTNTFDSGLDPALYLATVDAEQAVSDAAGALELDDCVPFAPANN